MPYSEAIIVLVVFVCEVRNMTNRLWADFVGKGSRPAAGDILKFCMAAFGTSTCSSLREEDGENSTSNNPSDCGLINPGDPEELFQIEVQLGEGSFGVVYKAKCTKDGCFVAVKALPIFENCLQSAAHELRILRDCQHPNVVGYHGYFLLFSVHSCAPDNLKVKHQGLGARTIICG
jgi:serine/threonine protein kinase